MNPRESKIAALIGSFLFASQSSSYAEDPVDFSKWRACQSIEDCAISKDPCEDYVGVNKNYLEEYTRWSEKELWHCRALADKPRSQDTRMVCLDSVCQVGRLTGTRTVSPEEIAAVDKLYKSRRKD
jgi:hypothetical protein